MAILPADIPACKRLWKETFGDTDSYIDRIFRNWVAPAFSACTHDERGEVSAMLCAHVFGFTGNYFGLYLHGLATRPDCRRQGLMTQLIRNAIDRALKARLDFLFLIPASQSLRAWYATLGFTDTAPRYWLSPDATPDQISQVESPLMKIRKSLVAPRLDPHHPQLHAIRAQLSLEKDEEAVSMVHSAEDAAAVLEEMAESGEPPRQYLYPSQIAAADPASLRSEPYGLAYLLFPLLPPESIHFLYLMD